MSVWVQKMWTNIMCAKKDFIWNPATRTCENGKYLRNVIDNSLIMCDEIIEVTKTALTKTVRTKCTSKHFYILLTFLLITIALLIAVSIYCYLIKYGAKQKHLLTYPDISNKLK